MNDLYIRKRYFFYLSEFMIFRGLYLLVFIFDFILVTIMTRVKASYEVLYAHETCNFEYVYESKIFIWMRRKST